MERRIRRTAYERYLTEDEVIHDMLKEEFGEGPTERFNTIDAFEFLGLDGFRQYSNVSFNAFDILTEDPIKDAANMKLQMAVDAFGTKICGGNIYHIEQDLCCMLSEVTPMLDLSGVRPPFDCFYISIPKGTVTYGDSQHFKRKEKNSKMFLVGVFVSYITSVDNVNPCLGLTKITYSKKNGHMSSSGVIELKKYESARDMSERKYEINDMEHETTMFILNLILYLMSRNVSFQKVRECKLPVNTNKKKKKKNDICRFPYVIVGCNAPKIGSDNFDLSGSRPRWKLNRRLIVSGHTKKQWYGEGRSKWKIITVLPYLKGPDNAKFHEHDYKVK